MTQCCASRKGNLTKCIPFYVAGGLLTLVGAPLLIVGIVGNFMFSDLVGYVGGICIFFGVLFLFIWHMITIPNLDKMRIFSDDVNSNNPSTKPHQVRVGSHNGLASLAYEKETRGQFIASHARHGSLTSCGSDSTNKFFASSKQLNNSNNVAVRGVDVSGEARPAVVPVIACISGTQASYQEAASLT